MDQSQSTVLKRRGLNVKTTHAFRGGGRGFKINCSSSTFPEKAFLSFLKFSYLHKYVNKKHTTRTHKQLIYHSTMLLTNTIKISLNKIDKVHKACQISLLFKMFNPNNYLVICLFFIQQRASIIIKH